MCIRDSCIGVSFCPTGLIYLEKTELGGVAFKHRCARWSLRAVYVKPSSYCKLASGMIGTLGYGISMEKSHFYAGKIVGDIVGGSQRCYRVIGYGLSLIHI